MSIAINIDMVSRVLLADGWHDVAEVKDRKGVSSFYLDAYEYVEGEDTTARDARLVHGGGRSGICATGFSFRTPKGMRVSGPLTAVLAVEEI